MATNDTTKTIRSGDKVSRSTVETESTERHTVRLARISEYEQHAVSKTQPFVGLLAAIQADLFRTAAALEDAVHQALGQPPTPADCLGAAEHETANFVRVVRQIADIAHLEITARMAPGRTTNKTPIRSTLTRSDSGPHPTSVASETSSRS